MNYFWLSLCLVTNAQMAGDQHANKMYKEVIQMLSIIYYSPVQQQRQVSPTPHPTPSRKRKRQSTTTTTTWIWNSKLWPEINDRVIFSNESKSKIALMDRPSHMNHPLSLWVRKCRAHWQYMLKAAQAMIAEAKLRFLPKVKYLSEYKIEWMCENQPPIGFWEGELDVPLEMCTEQPTIPKNFKSPPPLCMDDRHRVVVVDVDDDDDGGGPGLGLDHIVKSYLNLYRDEKVDFLRWNHKHRPKPTVFSKKPTVDVIMT